MRANGSLLVLGTDTGVGKTVISALIARKMRVTGRPAVPFKPVASGAVALNGTKVFADAAFLGAAARIDPDQIGLYQFEKPLSPHLAAAQEGRLIRLGKIEERFSELAATGGPVIVEGVGGVMTPLTRSMSFLDLAGSLDLPVVLVARAGLGTINHTRLSLEAINRLGIEVVGLVVNGLPGDPDEAERTNPEQLEELTGLPVLWQTPQIDGLSVEGVRLGDLEHFLDRVDPTRLVGNRGVSRGRASLADQKHVWHPFTQMSEFYSDEPSPPMIVRGQGSLLYDDQGREYFDGTSSLWVNVHGHRRREIDQAVAAQLGRIAHSTMLGLSHEPSSLLAEELVKIAPGRLGKVFYSDNGSTGVEIALKAAFQYWQHKGEKQRDQFVSFVNAYHGDTIGAVSVGGMDIFHSRFEPLLFETQLVPSAYCYRCPVGLTHPDCELACLNRLEDHLKNRADRVAAVILEPRVQGAAGMLVQPLGYLERVSRLCREHGVLLIFDEVATGFGRTGHMFAAESESVSPDIMVVAKGITGGYLPLAATLFKDSIYEAFLGRYAELKTFFHGHTYTGNPLACAAALASLKLFKGGSLLKSVTEKASKVASWFAGAAENPYVGDVRQCGLMIGIELVKDRETREPFLVKERAGHRVILQAREQGLIIRPLGDVVVLMPPLSATDTELEQMCDVTARAIDVATASGPQF
ncbi:MAG: adenosylmethionine--8-amino-7-oxononanoate transaminase [Terriglobia bacterium]